jgi:hypothetical protein
MVTGFVNKVWESLTLMWTALISPRHVFSRIESTRPFLLMWLVGCVFTILQAVSIYHRVGVDALVRFGLTQIPELKYSSQQIETMRRNTVTFFPFQVVGTALLWILAIVIVATVLFEIDKRFMRNQRSYRTVLSIVSYAQMPQILFLIAVCIVLWCYPDSSQFSVNALIGTNASLLVPFASVSQFWRVILSSLDVWTIWSIALVAIGLSSKQARLSKSFSYVFGLWFLYVLTKASISAMFLHHALEAAHRTGIGR